MFSSEYIILIYRLTLLFWGSARMDLQALAFKKSLHLWACMRLQHIISPSAWNARFITFFLKSHHAIELIFPVVNTFWHLFFTRSLQGMLTPVTFSIWPQILKNQKDENAVHVGIFLYLCGLGCWQYTMTDVIALGANKRTPVVSLLVAEKLSS